MKEKIQTRPSEVVPIMNEFIQQYDAGKKVVLPLHHVLPKWIVLLHISDTKSERIWEIATFHDLDDAIQFTAEEAGYYTDVLKYSHTFSVVELG